MAIKMVDLRACPFCRSKILKVMRLMKLAFENRLDHTSYRADHRFREHAVYCSGCGAYGPKCAKRADAMKGWGTAPQRIKL